MADGSDPTHDADLCVRSLHVRAIREEAREADFVCSTNDIDSYDEIVEQNWDLTRYQKNPVVLYAHDSRSQLPIGQARDVKVVANELHATLVFSKVTQLAEEVWKQILEKTLRAVSVGFRPKTVRWEKRDEREVYVLDDNELYEISVTPMGANPNALAKMKSKAFAARTTAVPKSDNNESPKRGKQESSMDEKEKAALESKIADSTKAIDELKKADAARDVEIKALKAQTDALVAERDAAKKIASDLESKLVEHEVESFVGKKITPAEKPDFVELYKSNKPLFERMISQRSELPQTKQIIPPDPKAGDVAAKGTSSDDKKALADFEKS